MRCVIGLLRCSQGTLLTANLPKTEFYTYKSEARALLKRNADKRSLIVHN